VGELEPGDDVAHGPDVAHAGVQLVVGDDEAAVDRDALGLEAEVSGACTTAHGDKEEL